MYPDEDDEEKEPPKHIPIPYAKHWMGKEVRFRI